MPQEAEEYTTRLFEEGVDGRTSRGGGGEAYDSDEDQPRAGCVHQ